jgi:hypothetical protein
MVTGPMLTWPRNNLSCHWRKLKVITIALRVGAAFLPAFGHTVVVSALFGAVFTATLATANNLAVGTAVRHLRANRPAEDLNPQQRQ